MAKTDLDFMAEILEARWEPTIDGRDTDVPKPKIVIESTKEESRVSVARNDVLFVRDGGSVEIEPKGMGYAEEGVTTPLDIEIRTTQNRGRFVGTRSDPDTDGTTTADRYGGLYGETKRVLDTIRRGEAEYDWAVPPRWDDLSSEYGFKNWVGRWHVVLKQVAEPIDPSVNQS